MTLTALNATYAIPGALEFIAGNGGLPTAVITTAQAEAAVSIYGAHVLRFRPKGREDVLWMSAKSEFEEGKPIRGGIPVCFPWFGPHATDNKKPQHGFARLTMWDVAGAARLDDGSVQLRLAMKDSPATMLLWPHAFAAEMIVTVNASLDVKLCCTNTGSEPFTYSDALHSYFAVSGIEHVTIRGLHGASFYESTSAVQQLQHEELLVIQKEENRRYIGTAAECVIRDAAAPRTIRVAKSGSRVTVVWNPWEATAKNIADMQDDGYKTMICVEAVNAYDDCAVVAPGERFCLGTAIAVE